MCVSMSPHDLEDPIQGDDDDDGRDHAGDEQEEADRPRPAVGQPRQGVAAGGAEHEAENARPQGQDEAVLQGRQEARLGQDLPEIVQDRFEEDLRRDGDGVEIGLERLGQNPEDRKEGDQADEDHRGVFYNLDRGFPRAGVHFFTVLPYPFLVTRLRRSAHMTMVTSIMTIPDHEAVLDPEIRKALLVGLDDQRVRRPARPSLGHGVKDVEGPEGADQAEGEGDADHRPDQAAG